MSQIFFALHGLRITDALFEKNGLKNNGKCVQLHDWMGRFLLDLWSMNLVEHIFLAWIQIQVEPSFSTFNYIYKSLTKLLIEMPSNILEKFHLKVWMEIENDFFEMKFQCWNKAINFLPHPDNVKIYIHVKNCYKFFIFANKNYMFGVLSGCVALWNW